MTNTLSRDCKPNHDGASITISSAYASKLKLITCSALVLTRVLKTTLVLYCNMETSTPHSSESTQVITMKLCTFDYVCETNTCAKFGWNPPARGHSTHTWNIHFWLFFLPSCLRTAFLFLRTCTVQTDRDNFTHNGSKDAVWRKEVSSREVFFSHLPFWGSFCPKAPTILPPPLGNPSQIQKVE